MDAVVFTHNTMNEITWQQVRRTVMHSAAPALMASDALLCEALHCCAWPMQALPPYFWGCCQPCMGWPPCHLAEPPCVLTLSLPRRPPWHNRWRAGSRCTTTSAGSQRCCASAAGPTSCHRWHASAPGWAARCPLTATTGEGAACAGVSVPTSTIACGCMLAGHSSQTCLLLSIHPPLPQVRGPLRPRGALRD